MGKREGTSFKAFKEEILKREDVREEYEALKPKYVLLEAIIKQRNQLELSQRELAKMAGMKQPAICRLESGDNNITLDTLSRVMSVLKLNLEIKPINLEKANTPRKAKEYRQAVA